jgi:hypothetical protein
MIIERRACCPAAAADPTERQHRSLGETRRTRELVPSTLGGVTEYWLDRTALVFHCVSETNGVWSSPFKKATRLEGDTG